MEGRKQYKDLGRRGAGRLALFAEIVQIGLKFPQLEFDVHHFIFIKSDPLLRLVEKVRRQTVIGDLFGIHVVSKFSAVIIGNL